MKKKKQTYSLPDAWSIPSKVSSINKSCYACGLINACEVYDEGVSDLRLKGCCNFVLDVEFKKSLRNK